MLHVQVLTIQVLTIQVLMLLLLLLLTAVASLSAFCSSIPTTIIYPLDPNQKASVLTLIALLAAGAYFLVSHYYS
jgi:hypothetical protein